MSGLLAAEVPRNRAAGAASGRNREPQGSPGSWSAERIATSFFHVLLARRGEFLSKRSRYNRSPFLAGRRDLHIGKFPFLPHPQKMARASPFRKAPGTGCGYV
jgi:hypothetical protein